jgi:transposase InsO family protein
LHRPPKIPIKNQALRGDSRCFFYAQTEKKPHKADLYPCQRQLLKIGSGFDRPLQIVFKSSLNARWPRPVHDLFSRHVLDWSLQEYMTREIVIGALRMAWFKWHPGKQAELIFQSGGGSPCVSHDFRYELTPHGLKASMSPLGNCWHCPGF